MLKKSLVRCILLLEQRYLLNKEDGKKEPSKQGVKFLGQHIKRHTNQ